MECILACKMMQVVLVGGGHSLHFFFCFHFNKELLTLCSKHKWSNEELLRGCMICWKGLCTNTALSQLWSREVQEVTNPAWKREKSLTDWCQLNWVWKYKT